jgi:hypothetical protein
MSGPHGGTYDGGRALQRRRLDMAIKDGWHIRYDGGADQFVAARDEVSAHTLDDLLVEMLRAQRGTVGDDDDDCTGGG